MNFIVVSFAILALFGALIEALPQRETFQRLPYYPPPTTPPRPMRVRRQVLVGQASTNSKGGSDARLDIGQGIVGTEQHNLIASGFAEGNTKNGPVTTGATLAYNKDGHGLEISKQKIPGIEDSLTRSAYVNLYNDNIHTVNANAFRSQVQDANGGKFQRNGYGLEYEHTNGHGAELTHTTVPGFGSQLRLNGKANLWTSADQNTRLNLNAGHSRFTSGPFSGKTDSNFGLGLSHSFGKNTDCD